MARLIIHAGFPKTGSTSLQAMLKQNSNLLPDHVRYVPHRWPKQAGVRRKARQYQAGDKKALRRFENGARWMIRQIAPEPQETIILSSEDFCGGLPGYDADGPLFENTTVLLRAMERAFAGHRMEFVLYTRDRERWLRSWHGNLRFLKRVVPPWDEWKTAPRIEAFDWETITSDLRRGLKSPLHVIRLEDDQEIPGPGTFLLELAGLEDERIAAFEPVPHLNIGPSVALQDIIQSWWFRRLGSKTRKGLKSWLLQREQRRRAP